MAELLKLVIVDDEEYVINGLTKHISWDKLGISIVGKALNGKSGIDTILKYKPDIVIVDIRMPLMDGLSMIQELLERDITPFFIIYSGFADFNYAKRAIKYGVSEYILKPSLPEDISRTFSIVAEECRRKKRVMLEHEKMSDDFTKYKPLIWSRFIDELLNGKIKTEKQFQQKCNFLEFEPDNKKFVVITIVVDDPDLAFSHYNQEQEQYILFLIASYTADIYKVNNLYTNFSEYYAHFIVSGTFDRIQERILTKRAVEIINYSSHKYGLDVTIGISSCVEQFKDIPIAYKESLECVKYGVERNQPLLYREMFNSSDYAIEIPNNLYREIIVEAIKMGDEDQIKEGLHKFINYFKEIKQPQEKYFLPMLFELLGATANTLIKMNIEYDYEAFTELTRSNFTIYEIEKKLNNYYSGIMKHLQDNYSIHNTQIMQKIINLVKENYSSGITLKEIASDLLFTPNYLSTLFSVSMGESFSSYITHYRMKKAKELLNKGYRVYETSDMVGYKNVDYFSKIFKDIVGVLPSDFNKTIS